jgi:3-mercaptopyruvate sulfurtransferase SseA
MSNDNFPPSSPSSRWLVSTDWLADHLRDSKVVVVDATYFLPQHNRDAHAEYKNAHIPGAVFFDIEAISDHSTELPHMLPGTTQFGDAVGALGIGDGNTVVVYDNSPLFSAARVWWTFRIFGAKSVHVLDGGLPKWKMEGRPLESGETKPKAKKFTAEMNVAAVALLDDVRMALADDSAQVVDARSAERFAGKAPEPRPGLRSGHMPLVQRALRSADRKWATQITRQNRRRIRRSGRRSRQTDHHHLRIRCDRGSAGLRTGCARQRAKRSLRRFLGGMGRTPRPSRRTRLTGRIATTCPRQNRSP